MSPPRIRTSRLPILAIAVSVVVLVLAGVFLYRWVDRLSELDRQRQQEDLDASMVNFQREFAATLHEAVWFFHPVPEIRARTPEGVYSTLYSQWKTTARWPQLINKLSIAFRSQTGRIILAQLEPATGSFEEVPWPVPLEDFRNTLDGANRRQTLWKRPEAYAVRRSLLRSGLLLHGTATLALPIVSFGRAGMGAVFSSKAPPPARGKPDLEAAPLVGGPDAPGAGPIPRRGFLFVTRWLKDSRLVGWCFLQFNLPFIQAQLLPFLVGQYFGRSGLAKYQVAVVTGRPERVVYASDSSVTPESMSSPDGRITLFTPYARVGSSAADGTRRLGRAADTEDRKWLNPPLAAAYPFREQANLDPDSWQLLARDRRGSLAIDVASARRRNLAMGFGTLLLLGCSIGAMVIALYRAHALASRQMEFVAGISHELRTPLAVIESAAFNLANGKVDGRTRVAQYGEVIQTEGRRLSDLVEQTLAYSGVQAGRQRYEFRPTSVLDVVDDALAEYDALLESMGWRVEKVIESSLPPVYADAPVLKSVIKNVIGNALKYASQGKWLRVTARAVEGWRGTEVQVTIADHGPGIDAADLPHIFEPFYRGHSVVASPIPGAGLGLSLVNRHMQAHGGRVSVDSTNGGGAEFALHLPSL